MRNYGYQDLAGKDHFKTVRPRRSSSREMITNKSDRKRTRCTKNDILKTLHLAGKTQNAIKEMERLSIPIIIGYITQKNTMNKLLEILQALPQ